MNYIALFQIIMFILPLWYIVDKYGIQESISASWYRLIMDNQSRWFNIFTIGVGAPMLAYDYYYDGPAVLWFALSGFFLFCVGILSEYKKKGVSTGHYMAALLAIVFGFSGCIDAYGESGWWHFAAFMAGAIGLRIAKIQNYTWWVECLAFALIIKQTLVL